MYKPLGDRSLSLYQSEGKKKLYSKLKTGVKSIVVVSPTGSGKTVLASSTSADYLNSQHSKLLTSIVGDIVDYAKKVLILVHREELLNQMREKHFEWFGIIPELIDAGTRSLSNVGVYIAMVETLNNRTNDESFLNQIGNVGLLMVDECHLSNFSKIFPHFPEAIRIGFTATPISANKKLPLNEQWDDIVVLATVTELLEVNGVDNGRGVVPCIDYGFSIVDRAKLKTKGDDFDDKSNSVEFSKLEQIQNTIDAINQVAYNKKIVIFNSDIDHSLRVHKRLLELGYNSRHLDSNKKGMYASDSYRKDTLGKWIENEPNAILNNVGIATIGTDIPSLECGVFNYCTKSITKYKQCLGRPARPFRYKDGSYKTHFIWIDTGDNVKAGGNWRFDDPIDWEFIFKNPRKKISTGVGGVKTCPECGAFNYPTATICAGKRENWLTKKIVDCGFVFIFEEKAEDLLERKLVRYAKNIDVAACIEFFKDSKEFRSYNELFKQIANSVRSQVDGSELEELELKATLELTYRKCTEWFKLKGRRKYENFRKDVENRILNELSKLNFKIDVEEYESIQL